MCPRERATHTATCSLVQPPPICHTGGLEFPFCPAVIGSGSTHVSTWDSGMGWSSHAGAGEQK